MYQIIEYKPEYRDDMLFCYLSAKDAMGKIPRLRDDLLDIEHCYFAKGDMFWLALNEGRVIGMIGTNTVSQTDLWLKRLFIKPQFKRQGLGSALLAVAEQYAREKELETIHTRFSAENIEAEFFYPAKGFADAEPSDGLRHMTKCIR